MSEHEWASRSLDSILTPRGYGVLRAYNARQALERAAGTNVDAVFIDRNLPDATGAETCQALLERGLVSRSAPIMLIASRVATREQRLEALRAGAWELIALPVDAEELLLRMDRFVRAKMDSDRAREEALVDAVTGLYSWEGMARRIREVAAAAERFGRPIACVVFAPDDGEGMSEMDEHAFLAHVAEELRKATRRSDVLGRIGPREFAIIAPDTTPEGAKVLADRLRAGGRNGATSGAPRARAGIAAIGNLRESGLDPLELVIQATLASRDENPAPLH